MPCHVQHFEQTPGKNRRNITCKKVSHIFSQFERGIMPTKRAIEEFLTDTADRRKKAKMRDEQLKIKRVLHSMKVSQESKARVFICAVL
jgi:ABC-type dipeptide/oligopeptide/nickel transport system ATPase subunit